MMTVRRIASWPFLGLYYAFSAVCMATGVVAATFWALAYWIRGGEKERITATVEHKMEPHD